MLVRFGYVAMSTEVSDASPSKTMTATNFAKLNDREAAIRKLQRLGAENLHNTLRLLRHNRAHDIRLYRCSSKLIPLLGHAMLEGWSPIPELAEEFAALGSYAREHKMRISFHPDHFTVLSTPKPDILRSSAADLERHVAMLDAMGLNGNAMCNIHVGGTYGDKAKSMARFIRQFGELPEHVRKRITLENDDKTYTARETLEACEAVGAPMVLDLHHHQVNNDGEQAAELWPRIAATWKDRGVDTMASIGMPVLPPKIHVSSPRSEKDVRAHADYVEAEPLAEFLRDIAAETAFLDVMIEAKMKDGALFRLMEELPQLTGIRRVDQASVEVSG